MRIDPRLKEKIFDAARQLRALPGELHIDPLEKQWISVALGLITLIVTAILHNGSGKPRIASGRHGNY
jgi:hypothetical protein